jgi:hypothetical protein
LIPGLVHAIAVNPVQEHIKSWMVFSVSQQSLPASLFEGFGSPENDNIFAIAINRFS